MLQNGFFTAIDDYPIAGGWGLKGKLFAVGDASGSVHSFDGTSGQEIWKNTEVLKYMLNSICSKAYPNTTHPLPSENSC